MCSKFVLLSRQFSEFFQNKYLSEYLRATASAAWGKLEWMFDEVLMVCNLNVLIFIFDTADVKYEKLLLSFSADMNCFIFLCYFNDL